jgi:hypothetical protein
MIDCAPHREFLAAVADGETSLVPTATLDHVSTCPDCSREVSAHQMLTARLHDAASQLGTPAPRVIGVVSARVRAIAAAAAAVIVLGVGGAAWFALTRPDPVQAAVNASSQPMQVESSDPAVVSQWCRKASGHELPAIRLDGMQMVGARMDRAGSTGIVTVVYAAPSGERVSVGWLEGQVPGGSGVDDAQRSGHELLVVHSRVGTAVIMGSSADAMWQTAAAIESA